MPTALSLYDNYTRSLRRFEPLHPGGEVGLYTCGPTVYDYQHIGNYRTFLFEDVLKRVLAWNGYSVRHVMNITDVGHLTSDADTGEDKMEKGARRTGKTAWEIAELYTDAFVADLRLLAIDAPTVLCKATDHIAEQIAFIADIERNGYAYRTPDGVYFDTSRQADYGHLARLDVKGLEAGKRVDVGDKRNPTDFALWKFSAPDDHRQMEWDSPWGRGFPGWHIECSAMAQRYLGDLFDIHCGGEDHIPVHHTNEIAQTEARCGTRLANYWLHGYFLLLNDAKMAKSAGEFLRVQSLVDRGYDPLAYRYLCLTAHYRSQLNFTWDALDAAATGLDRMRSGVHALRDAGSPTRSTMISTFPGRWRSRGTCCAASFRRVCAGRRCCASTGYSASASRIGRRRRKPLRPTSRSWPRPACPPGGRSNGPNPMHCARRSRPPAGKWKIDPTGTR
jgi:cysteinyl-tRNA synthetase